MIQTVWRVLGNRDDADDALQESLVRIWRGWSRVVHHQNPQALVLKICSDCAYDELRRRVRRSRTRQLLDQETSSLAEPPEELQRAEMRTSIITAIARLPRNQAVAFVMRALQQRSYQEIAAALGCAEVTARKHVSRARDRLSSLLTEIVS